jgi:hypothetical protein
MPTFLCSILTIESFFRWRRCLLQHSTFRVSSNWLKHTVCYHKANAHVPCVGASGDGSYRSLSTLNIGLSITFPTISQHHTRLTHTLWTLQCVVKRRRIYKTQHPVQDCVMFTPCSNISTAMIFFQVASSTALLYLYGILSCTLFISLESPHPVRPKNTHHPFLSKDHGPPMSRLPPNRPGKREKASHLRRLGTSRSSAADHIFLSQNVTHCIPLQLVSYEAYRVCIGSYSIMCSSIRFFFKRRVLCSLSLLRRDWCGILLAHGSIKGVPLDPHILHFIEVHDDCII